MQKEEKRRRLRELFNLLGVCRVIKTDALYIQLAEPFGEDLFLTLHRRVFAVAYEGLPHNHLALDNFLTAVTLGESWSDSPTMKLDDDNTLSRLHWDTVPKRRARTGEFWRAIRLRMSLYRDHSRSVIWKELRTLRLRAAWRAYRFHRAATRWLADSGWIDGLWGRYRPNVPGGMSTVDEAHRVLNRLVEEDVTRTCLRCGKDEWGADEHEEGCLLREAYVVLGDLDREQESS